MGKIADDEILVAKVLKYVNKLAAKREMMDETEYIMSSPRMAEILLEGEQEIAEGDFKPISIEDFWK